MVAAHSVEFRNEGEVWSERILWPTEVPLPARDDLIDLPTAGQHWILRVEWVFDDHPKAPLPRPVFIVGRLKTEGSTR